MTISCLLSVYCVLRTELIIQPPYAIVVNREEQIKVWEVTFPKSHLTRRLKSRWWLYFFFFFFFFDTLSCSLSLYYFCKVVQACLTQSQGSSPVLQKNLELIGIGGLFWYWKRAQVRKLQKGAGDPSDGYQHLRGRKLQEDFRRWKP